MTLQQNNGQKKLHTQVSDATDRAMTVLHWVVAAKPTFAQMVSLKFGNIFGQHATASC